jgi:hypothetical protein
MLLRAEEAVDEDGKADGLREESIQKDVTSVTNDGVVECIGLQVKGKYDKVMKTLTLWNDEINHQFDAVDHLLVFLYLINWRGGSFFPTEEEIKNPPKDGVYKTSYSYQVFNEKLKFFLTKWPNLVHTLVEELDIYLEFGKAKHMKISSHLLDIKMLFLHKSTLGISRTYKNLLNVMVIRMQVFFHLI